MNCKIFVLLVLISCTSSSRNDFTSSHELTTNQIRFINKNIPFYDMTSPDKEIFFLQSNYLWFPGIGTLTKSIYNDKTKAWKKYDVVTWKEDISPGLLSAGSYLNRVRQDSIRNLKRNNGKRYIYKKDRLTGIESKSEFISFEYPNPQCVSRNVMNEKGEKTIIHKQCFSEDFKFLLEFTNESLQGRNPGKEVMTHTYNNQLLAITESKRFEDEQLTTHITTTYHYDENNLIKKIERYNSISKQLLSTKNYEHKIVSIDPLRVEKYTTTNKNKILNAIYEFDSTGYPSKIYSTHKMHNFETSKLENWTKITRFDFEINSAGNNK